MVTTQLRLPTPSELYEPLLVTLGLSTGFEPAFAMHMDRLFFPTLKRFGLSDKGRRRYERAGLLYPKPGDPHKPTLWRKYQLAFRYMREGCVRGEARPRMFQNEPKIWMLTPFGADLALTVAPVHDVDVTEFFLAQDAEPRENLTLLWFRQNWTAMQPRVQAYMAKHLPRSAVQGLTEEHINTFVERVIRKDSFHDHLANDGKIYPSTLCNFVMRSAYTEMRTWGSDPSCRAIRGAVNERDRRRAREFHDEHPNYSRERIHSREHQRASRGIGVIAFECGDENRAVGAVLDTYGGDLDGDVTEVMSMESTIKTIAEALNRIMPNGEEAFELFVMKEVGGMTYREIATARRIPESRASTTIKRARTALREAAQSGQLNLS